MASCRQPPHPCCLVSAAALQSRPAPGSVCGVHWARCGQGIRLSWLEPARQRQPSATRDPPHAVLRLQAGGQGRQRRLQVSTGGLEGAPARPACSGVLDHSRLKPVLLVWGALRAVAACCSKRRPPRVSVCPTPNPVRPLSTPLAGASMPPAAGTTTRSVWGRNRASRLYGEQRGSRVGTGPRVHAACWSFSPFPVLHARLPAAQTALPGAPQHAAALRPSTDPYATHPAHEQRPASLIGPHPPGAAPCTPARLVAATPRAGRARMGSLSPADAVLWPTIGAACQPTCRFAGTGRRHPCLECGWPTMMKRQSVSCQGLRMMAAQRDGHSMPGGGWQA